MGLAMGVRGDIRVEDDLDDALAVAQINEDDAAVVAASVHPPHQDHVLPRVGGPEVAAVVRSLDFRDEV